MILLIDNYDSFSYNLCQLIGELDPDIRVIRNDEMTVEEIRALAPQRIILSPGPGRPEDAGVIIEVARTLSRQIPTLGVCLGHQAICAAYGAGSPMRKSSCTASSPGSPLTGRAGSSGICRRRRRWPDTIPWRRTRRPCRTA